MATSPHYHTIYIIQPNGKICNSKSVVYIQLLVRVLSVGDKLEEMSGKDIVGIAAESCGVFVNIGSYLFLVSVGSVSYHYLSGNVGNNICADINCSAVHSCAAE